MVVPDASNSLHWADYVVFAGFLLTSSGIGLFFGWKAKKDVKQRSAESFLTGGGDMHYLPVALSMMASFLSAIFVLSNPSEFYNYGTTYIFNCLGYLIGNGVAAHMHLPIIARLGITSGYEYLELRFNRSVRIAGSLSFSVMILLYMSVTLYLPALALQQATSLDLELAILTVGIVVTFYTAVGGMKATVWNDALQMIIVTLCLVLLIILGSVGVGDAGMGDPLSIASDGGRITFLKAETYDPNPLLRMTFWTTTVGGTFVNLTLYASSQTIIQKFISTGKVRSGQKAVWLSSVVTVLNMVLVMFLGLVMYAYYSDCDPQSIGAVEKKDQLVPLFVMQVMGHLHGMPGLFLATTFSASLSSVSGSVNSLAAVFLEDMIKPAFVHFKGEMIPDKTAAIVTRGLAVFFGLLTIALSFAAQYFGELVLQVAISVFGMVGSPLAGLLSVGMLVPCVNSWGAMAGLITSLALTCWIGIGAVVAKIPYTSLPMNTSAPGCLPNMTGITTGITTVFPDTTPVPEETWLKIYELSYMHYSLLAIAVVFIVAIPVSYITGKQDPEKIDPRLIFSFADEWGCCCAPSCKNTCRCNVEHERDHDYYDNSKSWKTERQRRKETMESLKDMELYVPEEDYGKENIAYINDSGKKAAEEEAFEHNMHATYL